MAKGQKRSNKEPKKIKGGDANSKNDSGPKKASGPKYLRQAEVMQAGLLRGKPRGQKA